jgi:hypothetical protein
LNDKLEALAERASDKELMEGENVARKWASWNRLRLITPVIAGVLAMLQLVA